METDRGDIGDVVISSGLSSEVKINTHPRINLHVSAPGKVILHGEHSVVYGRLAVATSLGLRTHLHLTEIRTPPSSIDYMLNLDFPEVDLKISIPIKDIVTEILNPALPLHPEACYYKFEHPEYVAHEILIERIETYLVDKDPVDLVRKNALIAFLYLYSAMLWHSGVPLQTLDIRITSEIKVASGMGSSASFSVCIAAAFLEYIKQKYRHDRNIVVESYKVLANGELKSFSVKELQLISGWALQAEKVMHGNPSGIDNSVCTFGSIVEYRKGCEARPLRLNHRLNGFLINTNVPKNTRALVKKVAQLKDRLPTIVENTLDSMEIVSHTAIDCLQKLSDLSVECGATAFDKQERFAEQYTLLNTLFDMNQNMLRILGVSHPAIDNICSILSSYGLHGKITGAGGGGYVICLVPFYFNEQRLNQAEEVLHGERYTCHLLELGGVGVMVE